MKDQRLPADEVDTPALSRTVGLWAAALLVIDLLLVAAFLGHIASRTDERLSFLSYWRWHGDHDRSFIEIAAAAQLVAAAVLLIRTWRRDRDAPVYLAWAMLFVVLAADDLGRLHEVGSHQLRLLFDLPALPGLRPDDTGEILIWGVLGLVPLVLLLITYRRSGAAARRDSWRLAGLCMVLLAFAAGLDMIYVVFMDDLEWILIAAFVITETVGELLAISALLICTMWIATRPEALQDPAVS